MSFTILLNAQDTVFMHTYGLQGYNYGIKTLQTSNGEYYILGNKSGFVGSTDMYVVHTNYKGEIIWDKAFGDSHIEWANDFEITLDKGLILCGYTNNAPNNNYNVLVLKTDSNGMVQWERNYGTQEWDFGKSVVQLPDSSYIVACETYGYTPGNSDILLMGISKNGDSLWSKNYGGMALDCPVSIQRNDADYCYISGYTESFGAGSTDGFLMKTTFSGDSVWMKTYGDTADDKCFGFAFTLDNGIALTGSTKNYGAQKLDGILIKTDLDGNKIWKNTFGGNDDDEMFSVCQNDKEDYLISGNTKSFGFPGTTDIYLIVADRYGNYQDGKTYGLDKADYAMQILTTRDKGMVITGSTESLGIGISNILVIKTDSTYLLDMSNCTPISGIPVNETELNSCELFPNPVMDNCSLTLHLTHASKLRLVLSDSRGIIAMEKEIICNSGETSIAIDFKSINSGIYFLSLQGNNFFCSKKIICIK